MGIPTNGHFHFLLTGSGFCISVHVCALISNRCGSSSGFRPISSPSGLRAHLSFAPGYIAINSAISGNRSRFFAACSSRVEFPVIASCGPSLL